MGATSWVYVSVSLSELLPKGDPGSGAHRFSHRLETEAPKRPEVIGEPTMWASALLGIEETVYEDCDLAPMRFFFADHIVADTQITVGAVGSRRLGEIASELGSSLDPERGHVLAAVTDCDGTLLEHASLSIEPPPDGATAFTVEEAGVSLGTDTESPGLAGALDVPIATERAMHCL